MNLTTLMVTLGVMSLPLGVYLALEGTSSSDEWFGKALIITGVVMLLLSMLRVWIEEKGEEQIKQRKAEY